MELTVIKTLSKRVEVSNANDAEKEYDIKAKVNVVSDSTVNNIESGTVTKDGTQKANFSQYSTNGKNVNFSCESSEEATVLAVINEFIDALPTAVAEE